MHAKSPVLSASHFPLQIVVLRLSTEEHCVFLCICVGYIQILSGLEVCWAGSQPQTNSAP